MADEHARSFDFAVIGGGIAGASVASELAADGRVILLEREPQPGYHTTGRSAALFSETYGPPAIRALSRASAAFFENPPPGFAENPLLTKRGVMLVATKDQSGTLAGMKGDPTMQGRVLEMTGAEVRARVPLLREGYADAALFEQSARDIDVHALHQGYLRRFKAAGGTVATKCELTGLRRGTGSWHIETSQGDHTAAVVVNAAGAWADAVAGLAGARPVGLVPKRRTALVVAAPEGCDAHDWPMVVDIDEEFYLKPDGGRFLISPADETPSPPCDAQPEELDIAICIDRIETAFDLQIRHVENKWAGLRSFVADKTPVAGFDPRVPGFFWLAGQGGYGIQSAPALARLAAALATGRSVPSDLAARGVDAGALAPERLEQAA